MRLRSGWLCVLLVTPLSMTLEIPDSTRDSAAGSELATSYRLGGGGGRYYREIGFSDCGTTYPAKQEFVDAGAEVDWQHSEKTHFGVRGGYIHDTVHPSGRLEQLEDSVGVRVDRSEDVVYGNVYAAREWRHVGLGAGVLVASNQLHISNPDDDPTNDDVDVFPTAHLRFGDLSRLYVSGHLFEGVPLYSGGGAFYGGVGVRPAPPIELYAGYSASGPYHEEGWMGRVAWDINPSWSVGTVVFFPREFENLDQKEYGVSASITYRALRPGSH